MRGIDPTHLRSLIGRVLKDIKMYSPEAVELLMLTAAQESHMGRYLKQINGPALGIFQMEPQTLSDLMQSYVVYRPHLREKIGQFNSLSYALETNIPYQIVVARIQYSRDPRPIPNAEDIEGLARYYKRVWNTHLGKATVEEAMNNYTRYAL